ncbi:MAG: penicillin acylase family protein [Bacteroidetes bacterium]|nr:penicillin acylase family protein [Bacteroidota bacterium]MBS1631880.1 penicillin acylase family protein [Bacteroidota bacterium]
MKKLFLFLLMPIQLLAQNFSNQEITRWEKEAKQVNIIRDNWGIPHVYGKIDADAVFGVIYAQCEDDFKRMEMNYIEKLGRMAEVKGESSLYDDLLIRMVIDSADAIRDYNNSPQWLKKLCNAFADGMNYYLYKHPEVHPALLNRFQPWYPLLWTDGSIGAINTAGVSANELKRFYTGNDAPVSLNEDYEEEKLTGSNGFAFSPSITESHDAILYINPHVTFYFRPEVHMVSNEGLNAYGAVTWGQFFVYQGFNEHCGWMHTSSAVDAADLYIEKLTKTKNGWTYLYNGKQLPVKEKVISIKYKNGDTMETKTFTSLFTRHGPIMTKRNGEYMSVKADNRILNGLIQCWQRTKAKSFADFKKTLDLKGNISNNTMYADAEGNIAYWHGNRIPIRDTKYDWSKPVDGTTSATEWKGYHDINSTVHSINPANGWLQNCNSTAFTCAGANSPKKENYPAYMAPDGENFRGINAVRVLGEQTNYTIDKVITAGWDKRLAAFEVLIPALIKTFETGGNPNDLTHTSLKEPINILKQWDYRCDENSIATTLAVTWGEKILSSVYRTKMEDDEPADIVEKTKQFAEVATADELIIPFQATINELSAKFGNWQTPWGEINRYQRLTGNIDETFDDSQPSLPDGFVSSQWGMIPSFASRSFGGTKKRYGYNGNSFISAVEFGKKIKAKSLLTGGESGDPNSKHFGDQALMYTKGQFKDVLFYKEDVMKHVEKKYHPGE